MDGSGAAMDKKKNEVFQVKVADIGDNGEGIGKADGFTWFIKDAVIGDLVEAKVTKVKKSYGYARLMRVLEPSPYRREPLCPKARRCGGCQLQAMDYKKQLCFKENKICNNLRRIGGIGNLQMVDEEGAPRQGDNREIGKGGPPVLVYPILGMEKPWRYRNKAQFPFGRNKEGGVITGFYASRTHVIIENEDCLLGAAENKGILACIRAYMEEYGILPYHEESHTGLVRHAFIRKAFRTGQIMVCLVVNGRVEELTEAGVLVERLISLPCGDSRIVSVSCNINREQTNVIMGKETVDLYGPGTIIDYIGDIQYRISPMSFFQVNPAQTERLYHTVMEFAQLAGTETVWDLYCGIGTISLFLAKKARMVYGVEVVREAIEDARANAELNGIGNVEFFAGKAEEVFPEQYGRKQLHADVVVVDPPRKGCDKLCLDTMRKMAPERIIYVSCDPATLARDLKYLCEAGYRAEKVRAVDMFPWSVHVEAVALLSKGQAG